MREPLSTPNISQPRPSPRCALRTRCSSRREGSPRGPAWLLRVPAGLLVGTDTEAVHRDTRPTGRAREVAQEGCPPPAGSGAVSTGLSSRRAQAGRAGSAPDRPEKPPNRGGGRLCPRARAACRCPPGPGPGTRSPAAGVHHQEPRFLSSKVRVRAVPMRLCDNTERRGTESTTVWWLLEGTSFHSDSTLGLLGLPAQHRAQCPGRKRCSSVSRALQCGRAHSPAAASGRDGVKGGSVGGTVSAVNPLRGPELSPHTSS